MNPGHLVADRFEVERHAASGGMGDVYRARDLLTGEFVALKVASLKEGEARFAAECALMAKLSHASIPRFVAAGTSADGRRYLALEWLDGEDLEHRLERERFAVDDVVTLGKQVAGALGAAHDAGVVHRDIKPPNLFLRRGDAIDVVVLDFGVAYETRSLKRLTAAGSAVGTPNYMSPEQARCQSDIDPRADVFALGAVLFECASGQTPFPGDRLAAVLMKILMDDPPRLDRVRPDVPEPLASLVARMLSKNREERPANGGAVLRELARIRATTGPPVSTRLWGSTELSPMSIVMCALPGHQDDVDTTSDTVAPADIGDAETDALRDIAARHAGRLELLPDGTRALLFQVRSGDSPSDARLPANAAAMAKSAVRAALEIRALAPATHIVVATGRGEKSARVGQEDAFARAAEMIALSIHEAPPVGAAIKADEATVDLVARWTTAEREGGSFVLRASTDPRSKSGSTSAERAALDGPRRRSLRQACDAYERSPRRPARPPRLR
ncbi:MAG: serine/threonine-protein kinase [Polyangiaceae bacterium]